MKRIIFITLGFTLFMLSAFALFEPTNNPTGFFVYTPNLAVINTNNNIPLNNNLEIKFLTKGTNDLYLNSNDNLEILDLKCDEISLGNNKLYQNYNCKGTSSLTIKVLSKKIELKIEFGNNFQNIINIAS